jgi:hypothetical protein
LQVRYSGATVRVTPSSWHDTVNDLIEDDPDFAVEIARDLLGESEVPGMPASLGPNVFNTRPSRDLVADKVVGVRELLRRIMTTTRWPVYSDLAKEHFGKGEEKGLEQGQVEDRRDTVLMIAEERGLMLTDAQRERITQCTDLAQLKKWSKAAVTAEDADDLFK